MSKDTRPYRIQAAEAIGLAQRERDEARKEAKEWRERFDGARAAVNHAIREMHEEGEALRKRVEHLLEKNDALEGENAGLATRLAELTELLGADGWTDAAAKATRRSVFGEVMAGIEDMARERKGEVELRRTVVTPESLERIAGRLEAPQATDELVELMRADGSHVCVNDGNGYCKDCGKEVYPGGGG